MVDERYLYKHPNGIANNDNIVILRWSMRDFRTVIVVGTKTRVLMEDFTSRLCIFCA